MQDDDGNEEQVSLQGDDAANLHSFTQQKLRQASPGIAYGPNK